MEMKFTQVPLGSGMNRQLPGASESRPEILSEVYTIAGERVLVEGIPTSVRARCGDVSISRETTGRVIRLVHGDRKNAKRIEMDVLAL